MKTKYSWSRITPIIDETLVVRDELREIRQEMLIENRFDVYYYKFKYGVNYKFFITREMKRVNKLTR